MSNKTKSFWIKLTAIVVAVALAAGTGLYFFLTRRPVIRIASRAEIIETFNEQGITRWLENELNVRVVWVDYSDDPFLRVSEDVGREPADLPDAYLGLGLGADDIRALMAQGHFINLEFMAAHHAPNLQTIINQDTDRLPQLRIDGMMISLPSFNERLSEAFPQRAWVNREWLQQSGLSMPGTPEDFLAMLRAFQEINNGRPVLGAAYGGSPSNMTTLGFLVHAFVTTDFDLSETSNYLNVRNGQIYAGVVEPGYREALRFLNTLYEEGLIDDTVFTQGPEVFLDGTRSDERYGVVFANDLNALFNDPDRAAIFEPLPPLSNNGHRSTLARNNAINLGGFMIPARISPERQQSALAFGDAMLSHEGSLTVVHGRDGWLEADSGALAMGAEAATWQLETDAFDGALFYSQFLGEVPFWMDARTHMARQAPGGGDSLRTAENWQGHLNLVTRNFYESVGRRTAQNILPPLVPTHEEMAGLNLSGVISYITQASRAFVTGARDIDYDWDDYVDTLNEMGLQDIINVMQEALNRHG